MQNIFDLLIGISELLTMIVCASLWIMAMLFKGLDSCHKTALLFLFVPPLGIIYSIFMFKVESMRLCHLSDKEAFNIILQSYKPKPEVCLKNR